MAWATRSDRDRQALNEYVKGYATVLDAWRDVPGLSVSIDKTRVEAALGKRARQIAGQPDDD